MKYRRRRSDGTLLVMLVKALTTPDALRVYAALIVSLVTLILALPPRAEVKQEPQPVEVCIEQCLKNNQ